MRTIFSKVFLKIWILKVSYLMYVLNDFSMRSVVHRDSVYLQNFITITAFSSRTCKKNYKFGQLKQTFLDALNEFIVLMTIIVWKLHSRTRFSATLWNKWNFVINEIEFRIWFQAVFQLRNEKKVENENRKMFGCLFRH